MNFLRFELGYSIGILGAFINLLLPVFNQKVVGVLQSAHNLVSFHLHLIGDQ